MRTLPMKFRERVVALSAEGVSSAEIAETLGVSTSWVDSIKRLHESGESLQPKSRANKRQSLARREGERIRARVAEHPGTTLEDLKVHLNLEDSIANIWYALRTLGLTLKKKHSRPANENAPTSPSKGPRGKSSKPGSIRNGSFFSTKRSARRI
jgi:transposase